MTEKDNFKVEARNIVEAAKAENRDLTKEEMERIEEIKANIRALDTKTPEPTPKPEENKNKEEKKSKINKMEKEFRLVRAIRSIANGAQMNDVDAAVIDAGKKEARSNGLEFNGQIQIPSETRAVVSVTAEGEDVVATNLYDILKPLREKSVLVQAGAKVYSGLVGDVQIPVMTKENVGWASELANATDGAGTFSNVKMTPKRLTAYIDVSKKLIAQDSIGVENAIREDLLAALNSKLEETVLGDAAGTADMPEGIFKTLAGSGSDPIDKVADFASIVNKEASVEDANVTGEKVYVMSNKAKAVLRNMAKSTKSTQLVYENGEVDGTKAFSTSNVADKKYIYGDFSNLAIANWGGLDLTVDPYTQAAKGAIRLVVNMYVDAKVLRKEAFTAGDLG